MRKTAEQYKTLAYTLAAIAIAALFWISGHRIASVVVLATNLLILSLAFLLPSLHSKIQNGLGVLGHWIGLCLGFILLTLLYWIVFVPGRIFLAIAGKDPMRRTIEPESQSYWEAHKQRNKLKDSYRRQF